MSVLYSTARNYDMCHIICSYYFGILSVLDIHITKVELIGYTNDMAISITEDNPKIRHFLETHQVGVLATASKAGTPHAATIYFVVEPDFTLYFITKVETTKHQNMHENPNVALAVFDAPTQTTVQVFGTVQQLEDYEQFTDVYAKIVNIAHSTTSGEHQPPIDKIDSGKYAFYQIRPTTIRMAEFVKAEHPPVDDLFETIHGSPASLDAQE